MKVVILLIVLYTFTFAQVDDPLKYFPYKTGDMWEYFLYDVEYPDTSQTFNISDSIDTAGNIYITQFSRRINPIQPPFMFADTAVFIIDKSFNVFCPTCAIENRHRYKLDAKQGDQWVSHIYQDSINIYGYELVRVQQVWDEYLFGKTTTFKNFVYYYSTDSTDTLGLVRYGDVLAKDFGLYWRGGGDSFSGFGWFLKGCVIKDTLYGDTTNIITSVNDPSLYLYPDYALYQNYPNPFNPSTKINYYVKERGIVQLIVYDVLGKQVLTLVNEEKLEGNYSVIFNGSNIASGVYFYSLRINGFVENKKMVLSR